MVHHDRVDGCCIGLSRQIWSIMIVGGWCIGPGGQTWSIMQSR